MKNLQSRIHSATGLSRRSFIKAAGAAAVLPGKPVGPNRTPLASNRITIGVIGWGMMGPTNTKAFLGWTIARSWPRATWTQRTCRPPSTPSTPPMATRTARRITIIAN